MQRVKQNDFIYSYGSEKQKSITFAHFSDTGYGLFAMFIMFIGFVLGINMNGLFGFIILTYIVCWVLGKFPNVMHLWNIKEKRDPTLKKYRIDKFK